MSKTIKQIADELGVSKTAVRKKMAVLFTDNTGNQFAETVSGVVYITVSGENLIKQAFSKIERKPVAENQPTTINDEVCDILKATIDTLQKQLEIKDIQLAEKDKQLALQAQALIQQQQLHQTDQIKTLQLTSGEKPHFLDKFKKKKKEKES